MFKSFEYTQALSVCNGWRHTTISQSKKVFSWLFLFFFSQVVISFSLQNLNHYCLRESFLKIVLNAIHPQTTAGVLAAWRRFNTFEVRPSDIPKLCTRDAKRSIIAFMTSNANFQRIFGRSLSYKLPSICYEIPIIWPSFSLITSHFIPRLMLDWETLLLQKVL